MVLTVFSISSKILTSAPMGLCKRILTHQFIPLFQKEASSHHLVSEPSPTLCFPLTKHKLWFSLFKHLYKLSFVKVSWLMRRKELSSLGSLLD
jgi:hypothetical protein